MKRIFLRMLTILGGISLFFFVIFFVVNIVLFTRKPEVPQVTVLELNLDEEIIEYRPEETIATAILDESTRLIHLLEAIERAGDDERVVALLAKVGNQGLGFARIQEIRDAVSAFRRKGKQAIVYTDTMGEFGQANGAYYLASAFDKIYIQPSGNIGLTGLIVQTPFIKGTLDMIGVEARMDNRAEYKNAMNTFTEDHYTQPHKEALEALLNSFFKKMVTDIARDRGFKEDQVMELFDQGLFTARDALKEGLIDGLYYRDEVLELVEKQAGEGVKRLRWQDYLDCEGSSRTQGKTIALIYGVGAVKRGKSGFSPISGKFAMGSETLVEAFRQAVDDEKVSAIIFRIDSPGGSYVASDTIWRETVRAKEKGIPIIVSMGNVAGSGGYFISMAADKIVAQPATITGSIGVFAGKMVTSKLWEKLGVSWDEIYTSENSTFWTGTHDYTPEQWSIFQEWLDGIYADFTSKVAQGRNMSIEKVLEVSRGRIWSGEDALELGLVDQLGGYQEAVTLAKELAGIDKNEEIQLKEFPGKKSMLTFLREKMPIFDENPASSIQTLRTLETVVPQLNKFYDFGLDELPGELSMPSWISNIR